MTIGLMLDFVSPCGTYFLTFEDSGRVAYAYLKERQSGSIVGDLWLYNRCNTPDHPEWTDRQNIPFANSHAYVSDLACMRRDVRPDDVIVDWDSESSGPVAYIYLFEDLFGVVGVGDKPGYARAAVQSNRLARVMELED